MFITIFWATGAVILSVVAWQLIFAGTAYAIAGIVYALWFLIRLPYFIVLGIWYFPRGVVWFFTRGWVPEFAWGAAVCLLATAVLAPIFSATF